MQSPLTVISWLLTWLNFKLTMGRKRNLKINTRMPEFYSNHFKWEIKSVFGVECIWQKVDFSFFIKYFQLIAKFQMLKILRESHHCILCLITGLYCLSLTKTHVSFNFRMCRRINWTQMQRIFCSIKDVTLTVALLCLTLLGRPRTLKR